MNITKSLVALMFAGILFTGCKETAKAPDTDNANVSEKTAQASANTDAPTGKIETASFNIEGMTCAMGCAKTIEGKLTKLDGVTKAAVDFDKKTATVEFDASKQSPEKIVETVEATGDGKTYKVSNLKSSGDHAMLIEKEKNKDKKKKEKKTGEKKECSTEAKEGKPGCCSAKKSCHGEEKTM